VAARAGSVRPVRPRPDLDARPRVAGDSRRASPLDAVAPGSRTSADRDPGIAIAVFPRMPLRSSPCLGALESFTGIRVAALVFEQGSPSDLDMAR
jgi:hypothetical protein